MLHYALSVLLSQWATRAVQPDFEPVSGKMVIFGDAMALAIIYDSFNIYVAAFRRVCTIGSGDHDKEP